MNTLEALTSALTATPDDPALQAVLQDALQEAGVKPLTASRRVNKLVRERMHDIQTLKRAESLLAQANGKRKVRTLSLADVEHCLRKARQYGWYAVGGDTVANRYGYPAYRTLCLVVVRSDGNLRVAIGRGSAKKGSSLTNPLCGLYVNASAEQFRAWADQESS